MSTRVTGGAAAASGRLLTLASVGVLAWLWLGPSVQGSGPALASTRRAIESRSVSAQPQGVRGTNPLRQNEPLARSPWENRILNVLKDLEGQRGFANVPRRDGRLLRLLVEAVNAKTVVEIGTSNGYSGLWICLGLRATGGHLITHEIDPERVKLARANFERAGVADLVTVVEGDAHETVKRLKGPIDVVFIDADKSGYLDYLRKLLPLVRKGGLILAHNVNYPSPGPEFLRAITTDPNLETLFLHMDGPGISVTLKKR